MARCHPLVPPVLLCILLTACGGEVAAPAPEVVAESDPAHSVPRDADEAEVALLALLQEARDVCVEAAAAKRQLLEFPLGRTPEELTQEFLSGNGGTRLLRAEAIIGTAKDLIEHSPVHGLLSPHARVAMHSAFAATNTLCQLVKYHQAGAGEFDPSVARSLASVDRAADYFSQFPIGKSLQAEVVAYHQPLIEGQIAALTRERDALRLVQAQRPGAATHLDTRDATDIETEKEEYRRWLKEQDRQRSAAQRRRAARDAALAESRRRRHDEAGTRDERLLEDSGVRTVGGPRPIAILTMRRWHQTYLDDSHVFRAALADYDHTPDTERMARYRHGVCERLDAASRAMLRQDQVFASPDPTVNEALRLMVQAFSATAGACVGGDQVGEAVHHEAALTHLRQASAAMQPYGLAP